MTVNQPHNAAYKLFHYPFRVRVPQYATYLEGEIEKVGVAISGFRDLDRECAAEMCEHTTTISRIARWHAEGVKIELYDIRDSVRMYDIIKEHLDDWLREARNPLSVREPPLDDLRMLDALADRLYLMARGLIAESRKGETNSIFSFISQSALPPTVRQQTVADNIRQSQHSPLSDQIANLSHRHREWRS